MKFGHIHEGRLVYARLPIVIADREYFTEDAAWMLAAGEKPANVARFAIDTVVNVVLRATGAATERYPGLPVLCSGGVASNSALRAAMAKVCGALFAQPRYSTDNAMGVAILAHRQWKESRS